MKQKIDPIKSEVIARFLLATAEEMGATLMRTAFSPNIKERADCSTAIFDVRGEVIALAQRVPIHLGSMVGAVDEIMKRFPVSTIEPGDMFVANDPYNGGGTHLPDINVIAPVFAGKKIVAFVANIAHHADVGGMVPGSEAAICTSIYQEGIRIPPVRIMIGGKVNRDVLDIVLLNSRTPDERVGDLNAQFEGYASTSPESIRRMDRALREFRIRGVASNLQFLENVINHPAFAAGTVTTRFIDNTPALFAFTRRHDRATRLLRYLGDVAVNGNPEVKGRVLPPLPLPSPMAPPVDVATPIPPGTRDRLRALGPEKFADWMLAQKRVLITDRKSTRLNSSH